MAEFNEDLNGKICVIIELLIMGYIIVPTGLIHIVYDEGIKLISSDGQVLGNVIRDADSILVGFYITTELIFLWVSGCPFLGQ